MTNPVFIAATVATPTGHGEIPLAEAAEETTTVLLTGEEARHARKVQRLREGESVDLVDGYGVRVRGVVGPSSALNGADHSGVLPVLVREVITEPAPEPKLVLVQALAKSGRDEQAVEMATEVGVSTVIPWSAQRSVVRWSPPKAETGRARWQRVATAAAKQARRAWTPQICSFQDSAELGETIQALAAQGSVVLICHEEASAPLSAVIVELGPALSRAPSIAVVVGPEGGVTDEELEAFAAAGATPVLLGNTVMRSSTAGPAVLAALNLSLGRW